MFEFVFEHSDVCGRRVRVCMGGVAGNKDLRWNTYKLHGEGSWQELMWSLLRVWLL